MSEMTKAEREALLNEVVRERFGDPATAERERNAPIMPPPKRR